MCIEINQCVHALSEVYDASILQPTDVTFADVTEPLACIDCTGHSMPVPFGGIVRRR